MHRGFAQVTSGTAALAILMSGCAGSSDENAAGGFATGGDQATSSPAATADGQTAVPATSEPKPTQEPGSTEAVTSEPAETDTPSAEAVTEFCAVDLPESWLTAIAEHEVPVPEGHRIGFANPDGSVLIQQDFSGEEAHEHPEVDDAFYWLSSDGSQQWRPLELKFRPPPGPHEAPHLSAVVEDDVLFLAEMTPETFDVWSWEVGSADDMTLLTEAPGYDADGAYRTLLAAQDGVLVWNIDYQEGPDKLAFHDVAGDEVLRVHSDHGQILSVGRGLVIVGDDPRVVAEPGPLRAFSIAERSEVALPDELDGWDQAALVAIGDDAYAWSGAGDNVTLYRPTWPAAVEVDEVVDASRKIEFAGDFLVFAQSDPDVEIDAVRAVILDTRTGGYTRLPDRMLPNGQATGTLDRPLILSADSDGTRTWSVLPSEALEPLPGCSG